jgi:hypothetical protein
MDRILAVASEMACRALLNLRLRRGLEASRLEVAARESATLVLAREGAAALRAKRLAAGDDVDSDDSDLSDDAEEGARAGAKAAPSPPARGAPTDLIAKLQDGLFRLDVAALRTEESLLVFGEL